MKSGTDQALTFEQEDTDRIPRRRLNWPIFIGIFLVAIITILAIFGPSIAPKDPAEENTIIRIEGQWYIPPFDMGTPGYPLGSDSFGRDLYSRLLWGIQPTMIMVVLVAVVRLFIGVIIGLSAGWFTGKTGRFLNGLIQSALAIPVLLVALGAIAIVGVELGIWAFIIGLSLTGWVDTALQVREQTRIVKGQVYVEAASALGASNKQILVNHILKQITPMLLMLFAFEISSTLMLTAGLGFLGYYIGGDVWVDTDDFVARRISGNPELGQMLATSWVTLTKPWAMVAVGSTVFITVLGFNLIGEGLRQTMGYAKVERRSALDDMRQSFGLWFDNYVWHPLIQFIRVKPFQLGMTGIAAFFLLSFGAFVLLDASQNANVSEVLWNYWQNEGVETGTQGSISTQEPISSSSTSEPVYTVSYDPNIVWDYYDESGFSGGVALSKNGDRIYAASKDGSIYSLELDGRLDWQSNLQNGAVGTPFVMDNGDILVADDAGGLNRISPQGEPLWRFQTEAGDRSHSGPTVAPDGVIYFTVGTVSKGFVQSVSPDGEGRWVTQAETSLFFESPQPSLDGEYIFLKEDIFNAQSGKLLDLNFDLDVRRFFSGQDGKNYLLAGNKIIEWQENNGGIEIVDVAEWDSSSFGDYLFPTYVGVTEERVAWMLYTSPGGGSTFIWVTMDDELLGIIHVRISASNFMSISPDLTAHICGGGGFQSISTDCAALSPDSEETLWKYHAGNFGPAAGGELLKDSLYLATEEGYILEINQNSQQVVSPQVTDTTQESLGSPSELGVLWSYQGSEDASFEFVVGPDGLVYLYTEHGELHIINADGQVRSVQQLGIEPYHRESQSGRDAPAHIEPIVLSDGTWLIISDENIIFAFDRDGSSIWEQPLESDPAEYPILDDDGNLYLIEENASLNVFNSQGLKWRFHPEIAQIPGHGMVYDAEGNFYYVVTNYSKGFIQALSPSGDELWITQVTTRNFYDPLKISSDGALLSLSENLVDTSNGEIITYDYDDRIDEFIFGGDGRNYLRSLHTVEEWVIGQSGFEIINSGSVSDEETSSRPPMGAEADANGIVWLYYQDSFDRRNYFVVWLSAEGDLMGRKSIEWDQSTVISFDFENSLIHECKGFSETQTLECASYSPFSEEPVQKVSIANVPPFFHGSFHNNYLYMISVDNSLMAVYLGNQDNQIQN